MINGLSKYTKNPKSAAAYLLDDMCFDPEANAKLELDLDMDYEELRGRGAWIARDPKPVLLEGDPEQMVALCDSLTFKNKYTTGVLSFSLAETKLIDATPGLKENLINELRDFAYAGVKKNDCKPMMVVQHTHTGRLELNYMIPRVHMESGKYFNPYPPNYDGRRGKGANDTFKQQNDKFVDYVCSKYGLQNPRDPQFAQGAKINKFDPAIVDKKAINEEVGKLIASRDIESRADIVNYLTNAGGQITRMGKDYISVKFDDKSRAIRLKGSYYGEQSQSEIRVRYEAAKKEFSKCPEEFEAAFREVQAERAGEVESRHDLKGRAAERAEDFDRKSTAEIRAYGDELSATKSYLDDYDAHRHRVNSALIEDRSLVTAGGSAEGIETGIAGGASDAEPILTGNPGSDQLIRAFARMQKKLASEEIQRAKARWQIDPQQEKMVREISDLMTKLFTGLATGKNLISGRPGAMTRDDIALARQMIKQQQKELQTELKAVAVLVKQRERVEPLRDILDKPKEPVFEAKSAPAAPADIAGSGGGLQTSTDHIGDLLGMGNDGKKLKPKPADDGTSGTTYG